MVPVDRPLEKTLESAGPRRADAIRNRERVLAAAEAVFSETGLKAQIEEVARRAGVGVGTVCRNFPTKQALVEAVLESRYESLLEAATEALENDDAASAFETFFHALADFQSGHRALAEQMATELQVTADDEKREALLRAVSELVARAQAAGAVRADIGAGDVAMLFSGIGHATAVTGDLRPVLHERYVRLILDGLRPADATPLPGRPLDLAQLRRLKRKNK
jgi:AcrR family transcriptional regulator